MVVKKLNPPKGLHTRNVTSYKSVSRVNARGRSVGFETHDFQPRTSLP